MKRAEVRRYGTVAVGEVAMPQIADGEVLVRVIATSVNPSDWYVLTGRPYLTRPMSGIRRPRSPGFGVDFAGVVQDSGADVEEFRAGDEVFGYADGAFAELVTVSEAVHHKRRASRSSRQPRYRSRASPLSRVCAITVGCRRDSAC